MSGPNLNTLPAGLQGAIVFLDPRPADPNYHYGTVKVSFIERLKVQFLIAYRESYYFI